MGLVFSIFNFFITKTPLANNWRRKKIPSCSYSALMCGRFWLTRLNSRGSRVLSRFDFQAGYLILRTNMDIASNTWLEKNMNLTNIQFEMVTIPHLICTMKLALTHLTWLIQTLFLSSNWNLDKIFAQTGELAQFYTAKKYFWFPSLGRMVIFFTESVIFVKTSK